MKVLVFPISQSSVRHRHYKALCVLRGVCFSLSILRVQNSRSQLHCFVAEETSCEKIVQGFLASLQLTGSQTCFNVREDDRVYFIYATAVNDDCYRHKTRSAYLPWTIERGTLRRAITSVFLDKF